MKVSKMIVLSSYSLSIYISNNTSMSFITKQQVLAPSLVLYSFAAWTRLTIRRSGNPRHSRSSELQSSSLLEFFCPQNYLSPLPKLPPSLMSDLPTLCSFLFSSLPKIVPPSVQTSDPSSSEVRCFFQKLL